MPSDILEPILKKSTCGIQFVITEFIKKMFSGILNGKQPFIQSKFKTVSNMAIIRNTFILPIVIRN